MSNTCLASEERSTTDRHPSDNLRARSDYFLVVVLFEFEPATQSYPVLYRNPNLDSRTRTSTGTVAETATRNESNLDRYPNLFLVHRVSRRLPTHHAAYSNIGNRCQDSTSTETTSGRQDSQ
jgi:hypothetical protein